MSDQFIRIVIGGALVLHDIAHAIALGALGGQAIGGPSSSTLTVRSWLMPSLSPGSAAAAAMVFWLIATVGFFLAAGSFWGIVLPGDLWRQIAVVGAVVSIAGIAAFSATWPGSPDRFRCLLDVAVAMTMNVAILATQLWLRWPPQSMFGK